MKKSSLISTGVVFLGLAAILAGQRDIVQDPAASQQNLRAPIHFEVNRGQYDDRVKFLARDRGYSLYMTAQEVVLSLQSGIDGAERSENSVAMAMAGANPAPEIIGIDKLQAKINYLVGADESLWTTGIDTFAKVRYREAYPGIDVVFYGNEQQLEYDFVVSPGADPTAIRLSFRGQESLEIDGEGNLVLHLQDGDIIQPKPYIYQENKTGRIVVEGAYFQKDNGEVSFDLAHYDTGKTLIIDPKIIYSSFFGNKGNDSIVGADIDRSGNLYVVSIPGSSSLPIKNPIRTKGTIHIAKFEPSGKKLVYSTYFGGSGFANLFDRATGIDVNDSGEVYITGETASRNFPVVNAVQTNLGSTRDAFLAGIDASGSKILFSTYWGGAGDDLGKAVDGSSGFIFVSGETISSNFPVSSNAAQVKNAGGKDIFVSGFVFDKQKQQLNMFYSSYLGGSGDDSPQDIAVDRRFLDVYIVGDTASLRLPTTAGALQAIPPSLPYGFIAKVNIFYANTLRYLTYWGGRGSSSSVTGVAVDGNKDVYVVGQTSSSTLPVTQGAVQQVFSGLFDGFITKIDTTGTRLLFSTYLGGTGYDNVFAVDVDDRYVYVGGTTTSFALPTTRNALQNTKLSNMFSNDAFMAKIDQTGTSLEYLSYFGGTNGMWTSINDVVTDGEENLYIVGSSDHITLLTTPNAFQRTKGELMDGFFGKVELTPDGITRTGIHSPSCLGNLKLVSSGSAVAGKPWTITLKNAPTNNPGVLYISARKLPAGFSVLGVTAYFDPNAAQVPVSIQTDSAGTFQLPVSIPAGSKGMKVYIQAFVHDAGGTCTPSGSWSASQLMEVTVQ